MKEQETRLGGHTLRHNIGLLITLIIILSLVSTLAIVVSHTAKQRAEQVAYIEELPEAEQYALATKSEELRERVYMGERPFVISPTGSVSIVCRHSAEESPFDDGDLYPVMRTLVDEGCPQSATWSSSSYNMAHWTIVWPTEKTHYAETAVKWINQSM